MFSFFFICLQLKKIVIWNFVLLCLLVDSCYSSCSIDVNSYTEECFKSYNTWLNHIHSTDRTFFSGVDVENIRRLCESYRAAFKCIRDYHSECPHRQDQIDVALVTLHSGQTDTSELCKDDNMLDVYARNNNCFILHGKYSESCFETKMQLTVSELDSVTTKPLNQFCSELKHLNSCISTNIRLKCGPEAESLVDILIRATMSRSKDCDKDVPLQQTSTSGSKRHNIKNSGSSIWNISICNTMLLTLIFIVFKHSVRL